MRSGWFRSFAMLVLLPAVGHTWTADSWPTRPVHIIVPAPAGGGSEILSRRIAHKLEPALGQPVVVEAKPGASGTLGTALAAKAAPDGYTLLFGHVGTFGMGPHMLKSLSYDPLKDFIAVTQLAVSPMLILVNAAFPAKDLKELVALARQKPGSIASSSTGIGTPSHVALEFLQQVAGIQLNHVPHKGSSPALIDMAGGQVRMGFDYNVAAAPHIASGKLRVLATTSRQRMRAMPNVPTVREIGFPELEIDTWTGIFVPAGTPPAVVERLNREIVKAMQAEDMRTRVEELGSEVVTGTPAEFAALVRSEYVRWEKVIKRAGIRIEE